MTEPEKKSEPLPLKKALMELIVRHGKVTAVGDKKPVSNRTQDARMGCIFLMFKQLKEMGHRLERPEQLRESHVRKLAERWEDEKLSSGTIQNRLSIARMFASWIGKAGMVRGTEQYLKDPANARRSANAIRDKSWRAAGVDTHAMLNLITTYDRYVGMQLRVMADFGLRREEAVMFKPHRNDKVFYIIVHDGTKGGRERIVPVEHPWQRATLDAAKELAPKVNDHIGSPNRDLKQALRRFNYVMERFGLTHKNLGVTSHGLRHQRFNDMFEEAAGIPSPVRCVMDEETATLVLDADPMQVELARAKVSSAAGHTRLAITNAYIGSPTQAKRAALNWTPRVGQPDMPNAGRWVRFGQLKSQPQRTEPEEQELAALASELGVMILPGTAARASDNDAGGGANGQCVRSLANNGPHRRDRDQGDHNAVYHIESIGICITEER